MNRMITLMYCSNIPAVTIAVVVLLLVTCLVGTLPHANAFTIVGTMKRGTIQSWTDVPSSFLISSSSSSSLSRTSLYAKQSKRSGVASRRSNAAKSNNGGTGFAKQPPSEKQDAKSEMVRQDAYEIYSRPALYDLAFGYRNYEEEVKFLLDVHDKYSQIEKDDSHQDDDDDENCSDSIDIIELAAGPARHGITALKNFQKRVNSCTAVDISKEMMEYSSQVADEELGDPGYGGRRDQFQYIVEDIRRLSESRSVVSKSQSYDSAWILLGSMQHMTQNDDVISCLSSASNVLRQGGTLIIELPHPRETFTMVECTRNGWKVPLEDEVGEEYGELKIVWGDDNDEFDPIRQVRDFTVAMELTVKDDAMKDDDFHDLESVKEIVPMRLFTYQEIDAMARIGGFHVVGLYGALSDDVDVHSEDGAFRLVCVLRKIRSPVEL